MVLTFAPIGLALAVVLLSALFGLGDDPWEAVSPLFIFGMAMVGFLNLGFCLNDAFKGKPDWLMLVISAAWTYFAGRALLHLLGVDN